MILYNNRLQLSSKNALYSDGNKYFPALKFLKEIKYNLPNIHNVLVLGTGLASIVHIANGMGYFPKFTLVDIDETVLQWALEFCTASTEKHKLIPVCENAVDFINKNTERFDVVFIDIFEGKYVPKFVTTPEFLLKCKSCVSQNGFLGFNYLINDTQIWESDSSTFENIFPKHKLFSYQTNRLFIAYM